MRPGRAVAWRAACLPLLTRCGSSGLSCPSVSRSGRPERACRSGLPHPRPDPGRQLAGAEGGARAVTRRRLAGKTTVPDPPPEWALGQPEVEPPPQPVAGGEASPDGRHAWAPGPEGAVLCRCCWRLMEHAPPRCPGFCWIARRVRQGEVHLRGHRLKLFLGRRDVVSCAVCGYWSEGRAFRHLRRECPLGMGRVGREAADRLRSGLHPRRGEGLVLLPVSEDVLGGRRRAVP